MKLNTYDYGLIGKRIQHSRKAKHYTQAELAEKINMSSKNLSQLERGMTGLSIPTLISLCDTLDVSADFILFGYDRQSAAGMLLSELSEQNQLNAIKVLEAFVNACKE